MCVQDVAHNEKTRMVGNILTGSQQSQLIAIKSAQRIIDRVQENLATGKDINSAIQAPQNFFTSRSLDNRASDIARLLDNINQSIKAVEETAHGIESIESLLDQAEARLKEARVELYSSDEPEPNVLIKELSDLISYAGFQDAGGTIDLDNDGTSILLDGNIWKVVELDYTITEHTVLRFEYQSTNIPEISAIGFDNDLSYFNNNAATVNQRFFLNGTQVAGLNYEAPTNTFEYSGSGELETIEIPIGEYFQGDFEYLTLIHDDDGGGDDGDALFNNITLFESNDTVLPLSKAERAAEYEAEINAIYDQIDLLAKDAHYRGINLLLGESMETAFNENRTSILETNGIDATRLGLGINNIDLSRLSTLDRALDEVGEARLSLRSYASSLQNNLTIITARENFARDTINTLQSGRDDLILADQNEEGANLLSLQTRQQIQFSTLAFSSQIRSVAELF